MASLNKRVYLILLMLIAVLTGCEKTDVGVVDTRVMPAYLYAAAITPDTVKISTLPLINGNLTVAVDVRLAVDLAGNGAPATVTAEVIAPFTLASLGLIPLHPDGTVTSDGYSNYIGRLQYVVARSDAGGYIVRFQGVSANGLQTNTMEKTLYILRNNSAPRISRLTAPDSVALPLTGSRSIFMTIAVADSDGAADIREVYFRSLASSDPTKKFFLLDDGGETSGDVTANDGIYSITVALSSTETRKDYPFAFQAVDSFGDTSSTLLHTITVR